MLMSKMLVDVKFFDLNDPTLKSFKQKSCCAFYCKNSLLEDNKIKFYTHFYSQTKIKYQMKYVSLELFWHKSSCHLENICNLWHNKPYLTLPYQTKFDFSCPNPDGYSPRVTLHQPQPLTQIIFARNIIPIQGIELEPVS